MENNQELPKFIAVKPKATLKVKEENIYGDRAVIVLTPEEAKSKMIELSPKAISILGLKKDEQRVGVIRGYKDEAMTQEGLFIFKCEEKNYMFVNDKLNQVSLTAPTVNLNTNRAKAAEVHGIITKYFGENDGLVFELSTRYANGAWLLEPSSLEPTPEEEEITLEENPDAVDNPASEDVEVEVMEDLPF